jgi:hypothetical protein
VSFTVGSYTDSRIDWHTYSDQPRLVGWGEVEFSTSLELVSPYRMVWDTNGYYRELGVKSRATRREIREAYQAKAGWRSTRLTYIVSMLLNAKTRAAYDRTPLGMFYVDDYVQDMWRRERVRQVIELLRQGMKLEADRLSEEEPDWTPAENLSQGPSSFEVDDYVDEWQWSFYQWGTYCMDMDRLREWQHLLVSALGERKEHHQIAVGFSGQKGRWGVRTVGFRIVVFLDEDEQPSEALAVAAASRVVEHNDIRRSVSHA